MIEPIISAILFIASLTLLSLIAVFITETAKEIIRHAKMKRTRK